MAAKEVRFSDDSRQRMFRGVNILANAVKATLGPKGRNAVLDKSFGAPTNEAIDVHISDARLDQEMNVDAVAGNLVADEGEDRKSVV